MLYTRLLLQGNAGNQKHEQFNLDLEQELLVPHLKMVPARALSQNPTLKSQALVLDQAQGQEVQAVCPHLPDLKLIMVLFVTIQNEWDHATLTTVAIKDASCHMVNICVPEQTLNSG